MTLVAGASLGPYEIRAPLGAGGMGEVYRAKDTRLDRDVAIKVLPAHLATDAEALKRFEREAKAVAALSHPNILAVYDVGTDRGISFVVTELLQGQTLRTRIAEGKPDWRKAVEIAALMAEGLAAAHSKGITHRDVKPENIFITSDGRVKILDFGLARHVPSFASQELTEAPTKSLETAPGILRGTVPYMSPEQVRGSLVDARSDIFSLGCVLYEMIAARRPFSGETAAETMTAILKESPPSLRELDEKIPSELDQLIRHCLEKNPEERFQSARDLAFDLRSLLSMSTTGRLTRSEQIRIPLVARQRRWMLLLFTFLLVIVAFAVGWFFRVPEHAPAPTSQFVIPMPEGVKLGPNPTISPDGKYVVFVGQRGTSQQLYLRAIDQVEAKPLLGGENADLPFFSPDGQWVGFIDFIAESGKFKIKKVPAAGGSPQVICDVSGAPAFSAAWGSDNHIVFGGGWPEIGLFRVSAAGGTPKLLTAPEHTKEAVRYTVSQFLPGDKAVLFTIQSGSRSSIAVFSLNTGKQRTLIERGSDARYVSTGHLIYTSAGQLFAVPFDAKKLQILGSPVSVLDRVNASSLSNPQSFAVSENGSLVYVSGVEQGRLVWIDRKGVVTAVPLPMRGYLLPALSPDDNRVAVTIRDAAGRNIWLGDLVRGSLSRLTFGDDDVFSLWSPDGRLLLFTSGKEGQYNVYRISADGSTEAQRLTNSQNPQRATSWSLDGRIILLNEIDARTSEDIMRFSADERVKTQAFIQTPFREESGTFSPDSRWVAYESNITGRFEIYVNPFPGPGEKRQISIQGGVVPRWNPRGKELFYLEGNRLMRVSFVSEPVLQIGKPEPLFEMDVMDVSLGPEYDISKDGERFLFVQPSEEKQASPQLHVVLNWFEELQRRVPKRN